jgi:hypothetical protein
MRPHRGISYLSNKAITSFPTSQRQDILGFVPTSITANQRSLFLLKRHKTSSSSSSSIPPPKNPPLTKNSSMPDIKFEPHQQQGNSILHEKAARAAELHAELNALLESQAKRRAEEANRPFGAGLLDFAKKSKSELINIFSAFTCVLLAWQIVSIRRGAKKLIQSAEESQEMLKEYQQVLKILSSDDFVKRVENSYKRKLQRVKEGNHRGGASSVSKGWFGSRSANKVMDDSNGVVDHSSDEYIAEKDVLSNILRAELSKVIGDRAMSAEELQEKKLLELQREMGLITKEQSEERKGLEKGSSSVAGEGTGSGLDQILVQLENDGNESQPSTVVKRSKGFI